MSTKLDINEDIIKTQLLINEDKNEIDTLFPLQKKFPSTVIKPSPGICVKTKNTATSEKTFINVCTSDVIPAPEDISNEELINILESDNPSDFRIPMSIGSPHEEKDKSGQVCIAFDIVINSKFLDKISDNPLFSNFFMIVTIEGLEEKHSVTLDKNCWIVLKNKKYHGNISEQTVRTSLPLIQELSGIKKWTEENFPSDSVHRNKDSDDSRTEPLISEISTKKIEQHTQPKKKPPKFSMRKSSRESSKEGLLEMEVELPGVVSAEQVTVDIGKDRIVLEAKEYFLDELVPYVLIPRLTKAFFIKNINSVVVVMPYETKQS